MELQAILKGRVPFMYDNLIVVCNILLFLIGFFYIYRSIYAVVGVFYTKKFSPAKRQHKYAVVIAARNEEAVIGNLLDSIAKQDYPKELVTVFVVADNCTDNTAEMAKEGGAVVYRRFDKDHCTKGYALQYLFEQIERDYGIARFEGFFVFDADNLLKRDYINRMNDAFDSGEKIITSYRNTKNFDDNWISASYALHWLRTVRFESRARSAFHIATRIQGTGYLIASELVKNGWRYTSLTEDRALSADAVVMGVNISYQHEAEFYDEQPNSMKIAWRQRIRWAKGNLQVFIEFGKKLFLGIFKRKKIDQKFVSYDMLLTNVPSCLFSIPLKLLKFVFMVCSCMVLGQFYNEWQSLIFGALLTILLEHAANIPVAALLFIMERNRIKPMKWYKKLLYCLTFPFFGIIGDISTCISVFRKVSWKPIPHKASVKIEELETASGPSGLFSNKIETQSQKSA